jgi:hypothetical protein
MQRAKVTNKDGYMCAPDGHTTITIPFGEILTGDMAKAAIASNEAKAMGPERKAKGAAPENKAASL